MSLFSETYLSERTLTQWVKGSRKYLKTQGKFSDKFMSSRASFEMHDKAMKVSREKMKELRQKPGDHRKDPEWARHATRYAKSAISRSRAEHLANAANRASDRAERLIKTP